MKLQIKGASCLLAIAFLVTSNSPTSAQQSQLGKVEFATSGSPRAQEYFLRGLAALHSFWYEEALEAFREATKADPDFMMGYWGEAMASNHPLWGEQDTPAARVVLAKIKDLPKLTARERSYLNAVKALYGEGDKRARDHAYSTAMEKVYRDYPDDLDAAAFYSLSLLGLGSDAKGYRLQVRAGAIAMDVYQRNPNHPGAAHYIIHAFDDPDHAILALPAARRYASIAPEAHHARHMPSHIFLQLGMWPEAAASNESAWEASDAWMKRKQLSPGVRDYHSLHWLLYVYLQQGRYAKAEELLTLMKQAMGDSTYSNKLRPGYYESNYANMAAAFVVETERWELAKTLFPASESQASASAAANGHGGGHGTAPGYKLDQLATLRVSDTGRRLPGFVRGLAAGVGGAGAGTLAELSEVNPARLSTIQELEVNAVIASAKRDHTKAEALMKQAVTFEEESGAPSGPPSLIKPAHELFGELLLKAGKPAEAAEQFQASLLRQPNRARSLLGAARAAAQRGDKAAALTAYAKLLEQWQQADAGLPELREAQEFMKAHRQ
jgi:tetratricopeptide (TPR) repeat protein